MSCPICEKLKDEQSVDYEEGESLPTEYKQLIRLSVDWYSSDVLQCPECKNYYTYESNWDNDVYNRFHWGELKKVSAEVALQLIRKRKEADEADHRNSRRKILKVQKRNLDSLEGTEKLICDFLLENCTDEQYQSSIREKLSLSRKKFEKTIKALEKKKVLYRKVYWPLRPGEHNFQEAIREGDPEPYTTIVFDLR